MSGGEQQMVAIGRALMSNPTILMLDEPSLGLSPLLAKELFRSLKAVRETGVGILLVEQNAKQSLAIADRGYLIENGHITGEGTGADLAGAAAANPAVQNGRISAVAARRIDGSMAAGAVGGGRTDPETACASEHRQFYVRRRGRGSRRQLARARRRRIPARTQHVDAPAERPAKARMSTASADGHGRTRCTLAPSGDASSCRAKPRTEPQAAEFVREGRPHPARACRGQRVAYHPRRRRGWQRHERRPRLSGKPFRRQHRTLAAGCGVRGARGADSA